MRAFVTPAQAVKREEGPSLQFRKLEVENLWL